MSGSETVSADSLVSRAVAGDLDAFEELYRLNVGRVYGLCLRMTGDRSTAEDLTQDAFVRAWRRLGSFRGKSSFATWVHRIAVNLVLSYFRGAARREISVPAEEHGVLDRGVEQNPSIGIDLDKAIQTLSPKARLVFLLHDVGGYRHREIAEMAGVAEGTSKAHLHRARQQLRKVMKR